MTKTVCVVGLGYVGFPLALKLIEKGYKVRGLDISERVIKSLNNGNSPIIDGNNEVKFDANSIIASSDYNQLIPGSDMIIITVPTPITDKQKPDLLPLRGALKSTLANVVKGTCPIIIIESTVYPGVSNLITREIATEMKLEEGLDFNLAYCPERVSPGGLDSNIAGIDRVLGANSKNIGEDLKLFYQDLLGIKVFLCSSIEVAEASKLIENVQRDINIAFFNELTRTLPSKGIDVNEVIQAASTKWNFQALKPGIGVGGHCIPVDPYYYLEFLGENYAQSISRSARKINEEMPAFVAREIMEISPKPRRILILGYAYKENVGDCRETPVMDLCDSLISAGAQVMVYDPLVPMAEIPRRFNPLEIETDSEWFDMVVVATAHDQFVEIDFENLRNLTILPRIYDGRGLFSEHEPPESWTTFSIASPVREYDCGFTDFEVALAHDSPEELERFSGLFTGKDDIKYGEETAIQDVMDYLRLFKVVSEANRFFNKDPMPEESKKLDQTILRLRDAANFRREKTNQYLPTWCRYIATSLTSEEILSSSIELESDPDVEHVEFHKVLVVASATPDYVESLGDIFLEALRKTIPEEIDWHAVFAVPFNNADEMGNLDQRNKGKYSFVGVEVPESSNFDEYSLAHAINMRFYAASSLLRRDKCENLVVIDLDCVLSRSFDWTFSNENNLHDVNLRFWKPENPVPWKNVAAGVSSFSNTDQAKIYMANLSRLLDQWQRVNHVQPIGDQCVLEASIRMKSLMPNLSIGRFHDPTWCFFGPLDRKVDQMKDLLNKLEDSKYGYLPINKKYDDLLDSRKMN